MPGVGRSFLTLEVIMRNRVMTSSRVRFGSSRRAFVVAFLLCVQFTLLYAGVQEGKTLSEKPHIIQVFDPGKNETEIKVFLSINTFSSDTEKIFLGKDKSNPVTISIPRPGSSASIQSGLLLGYSSHIYEGRTPSGKQSVRLAFYSKRKDTFKDQSSFSITGDGQTIHEGVAEPPTHLASDKDFKQKIIVSVPTEVFLRIARAKKVEFKLGTKTYAPEGFQQKSMQALANIIAPQSK